MSVRRLAEEAVQPERFAFSNDNAQWAEWKIGQYPAGRQQSAVIPLLMRAQDQEGWVSRAAIESIADMLDMPYIRVLEVATFYTQFQLKPVGTRAHIQVCGTTPCMLRGAEDIRAVCQSRIHPEPFETNADGTLSWEEVECLGACVNAPMVAIFHDTYEDLTPERMGEIIDAFAAGRGDTVQPGPQNGRTFAAAATGQTTLRFEPDSDRSDEPVAATPAAAADPTEPTAPGRGSDVVEETAPGLKGPAPDAPKVSMAEAEAERAEFDKRAEGGEPNDAMREGAVGAEAAGGKLDEGKAVGKPSHGGAGDGASSAGPDADDVAGAPKAEDKSDDK
ncbi:NADH-quinone oxidoreductase subunit NuoE [Arsenicitalea aurantiaca]|uniref:NADH-quinone oxidoreductase subunit NuoE n=1 Tax=Arsenicitalea aurantiaca TaxID=1783274 RepID=A0A433XFC0_9HYPH|nr:NADH-quinone oxidoreductase subunit NuoE [Arsenicitalea aurantiaca]RUT32704.1 NADH-quinone oxidoreductase subunit NuoE [Arsenicitalea aurantiaca]